MAIPGVLGWSVAPPSVAHFLSSRYRILVSPILHAPFTPLPSPSPSTTPPSNPVVSATCACPGRGWGWGGCKGGGGLEGWKLRNVSLLICEGGVPVQLPPSSLEIQLSRFGVRNSTCVLEGKRKGGQNATFCGVAPPIPSFLVVRFLSSCCFGLGLPGLIAIFLLHLDMFSLVSTYNAKRTCP